MSLKPYLTWQPTLDDPAFIADSSEVIGRVDIGQDSSIWYQAVLRGDVHDIRIGQRSNIQDHCTVHTSHGVKPCIVGDDVTVGHRAILHGCEIQNLCLIGMGAILMDGAVIESGCIVAAGTLVPENKILRGGYLYAGVPAREIRPITDAEKQHLQHSAQHYVQLAKTHQQQSK
ncbi:MAG: gamma carbonic anhydrase family protein [Mariprofundaceae bacterium]|nr:gamma carbonic anhydrase family protein [Mariprofundaceae bacterium]